MDRDLGRLLREIARRTLAPAPRSQFRSVTATRPTREIAKRGYARRALRLVA